MTKPSNDTIKQLQKRTCTGTSRPLYRGFDLRVTADLMLPFWTWGVRWRVEGVVLPLRRWPAVRLAWQPSLCRQQVCVAHCHATGSGYHRSPAESTSGTGNIQFQYTTKRCQQTLLIINILQESSLLTYNISITHNINTIHKNTLKK